MHVVYSCAQSSVATHIHLKRYRVVQAFLMSGTPLSRLSYFRSLLDFPGSSMSDESHLSAVYIPRIEEKEFLKVESEISGRFTSIAFDGTSRLGEAVNITGRYCSESFDISIRLLRCTTRKLHMNATALASAITRVLCTEYGVLPERLVCLSRDSVLVNGAACKMLMQSPFSCAENQLCISHTLNNVGSRLQLGVVKEFMTPWLELVGGRHPHAGAKALWRATVNPQVLPHSSLSLPRLPHSLPSLPPIFRSCRATQL